jgi:hypothetical protein
MIYYTEIKSLEVENIKLATCLRAYDVLFFFIAYDVLSKLLEKGRSKSDVSSK